MELLPFVHIPRYWGIATKCLTYAKTSTDPFVYCLLRQQYRRVLVSIISRVMGKDRYSLSAYSTSSTLDTTDDNNCVARITWALVAARIKKYIYWFNACRERPEGLGGPWRAPRQRGEEKSQRLALRVPPPRSVRARDPRGRRVTCWRGCAAMQ